MLRSARETEAQEIHALLWSARPDIPLVEAFQTDGYLQWVADRCRNKVVWVVTKQSKIVDVMVMEGKEIFYLVISIEHRRKGIGRRLIKKAKALCGEGGVKAKVAPENTPVARLLAAEGFRFDGIIPGIPGSITESWIGYSWSPD